MNDFSDLPEEPAKPKRGRGRPKTDRSKLAARGALKARLASGNSTCGAVVEFDNAHFAMLVQITVGEAGDPWSESEVLTCVPPHNEAVRGG